MRRIPLSAVAVLVSLFALTSGAQAVVVDMNATGQTSVAYNASDQSGYYGVALVPGTAGTLASAGIPTVTASAPCLDPVLPADLSLPSTGLCSHGGPVMHSNETFALTWDPLRRYWETTRDYVEQFLSDVAAGSGTLTSPYAVTTQYSDATGRAGNTSIYGGGCIDYGVAGGSACQFGATNGTGTGTGEDYPASGCPVTGTDPFDETLGGAFGPGANDVCLTDAQLQGELSTMVAQTGMLAHTEPGYTPLVVLLTPPGIVTCLDAAGTVCSANSAAAVQFCSYHSQVEVAGTEVAYVVQPWTPATGCDEPDAPTIPQNASAQVLATDVGIRLVSPLSQSAIAAIVDPGLNGWYAHDGAEINDNGCMPLAKGLDNATVGTSAQNPYLLQREFNNAGVIETDPNAPACAASVVLTPTFIVPSAVNKGDVVEFDGSTTASSLIVPKANYFWNFGDGKTAVGPSVEHSYVNGGTYTVKLSVIDRGGNFASLSQTITVLGPTGKPVTPPPPPATKTNPALHVHLQLLPQGRRAMLTTGVAVRVRSNEPADGFTTLMISRGAANRAQIKAGRGASVVIGRGTISGITAGTVNLHLRLPLEMATKLGRLSHVTLTVRLALTASGGDHLAVDAAGRY